MAGPTESPRPLPPPAAPPAPANPFRPALPWLGLALLLALQYGMFRVYAEREVSRFYPRGYDQSVYLARSYTCYEQIIKDGPLQGVLSTLRRPLANGLVFEVEASLLFLVLGPSRLSALTVSFAHFALFQFVLAATLRWRTGRWGPAFLGVGLLLTAATTFYPYGGMADFRLDFAAFCLYGVFLCAVMRSDVFASWRWSLAAGAAAAWLVLTRHLSAVYLAGACAGFLGLLGLGLFRRDPNRRRLASRRVVGLLLAGLTLAALAVPVVLWKWPVIRTYYLGHIEGSENKVRGQEFGASDLPGRVAFYFRSLVFDHAGTVFLALAGFCLAAGLGAALLALWRRRGAAPGPAATLPALAFVGLSLVAPFAALTLYSSPSPVVGNVMVAALLWLVLLGVLALARIGPAGQHAVTALAVVAVAVGLYHQASGLTRPVYAPASRTQVEDVTRLYERIGDCCRRHGWSAPRVAFATIDDTLFSPLVTPVVYERQGVLLTPVGLLGGGVDAVPEATAVKAVRDSDIAVVPLSEHALDVYPFVRCMRAYRPRLLEACRETHVEVGHFHLPGAAEVVLFARRAVRLEGADSDGWVPDSGLTLVADVSDLKGAQCIELRGPYHPPLFPRSPVVQADLAATGEAAQPLSARLTTTETSYRLVVELPPHELSDTPEVRIHLGFDASFRPAEHPETFPGNNDSRRLVLRVPDAVAFH